MKRRRSKSIKRPKISLWPGLVLALGLAVMASWFLGVTKAQIGPGGKPQSSGLRVLVKTNAGDAVTSSPEQPSDEVISDLRSFLTRYPGTWRVDIDKAVVKNLTPTTPILITSSPKDFSINLLGEFSNIFGLHSEETAYVVEFNLRNKRIVEYRQRIGEVPIENSFITFSVDDSKLEQVTSRVYPEASRNLSTTPTLEKQVAIDVVSADFRRNVKSADSAQVNYKTDLVVLPLDDSYFLTWKVVVDSTGSLDSFTYYVDAHTGRVIQKYSNVLSQQNTAPIQQSTGLQSNEESSAIRRESPSPLNRGDTERVSRDKNGKKIDESNSASELTISGGTWQTILSENFDTLAFPYGLWRAFDNNGSTGGNLFWDDQNCVSHDPSWSLWAAAGGTNRLNACADDYVNNMDSWVTYGPFDLSGSTDGLLDFHLNNVSELDYDLFKWLVSVDGTHFYGYQTCGNSNGWQYKTLDFKSVPTLGNITGGSQVWIAFVFTSDSSIVAGKGPFIDDVAIKKMSNSSCMGVSGHVGGHIYGRNQNELQLRDFKNMKVVLNNTLALDFYAVTNASGNYSSSQCSDYIRFELEGYDSNNFLRVRDCNNGNCPLGGDLLASQDFSFSSQLNFDWNVDAENKKEVNVFWHLNEMHDWYRSLLGQDLMNYQMQAYVDYVDIFALQPKCAVGRIQAFYSGSDRNIYFCPSDVSRESDVIYHEYTHGVVDHIPNYSLPGPDERGAMSEGIADYYAAVKNNDPEIGEGVGTIRTITKVVNYNNKCYPEVSACSPGQYKMRSSDPQDSNDNGYIHDNSLVPSGALWNLRQNPAFSGSYVDKLVFDTLILRKPLTFSELLNGLIAQDGGTHEAQIRAAFATRGVTTSSCTYGLDPASRIFIASASTGSFNVSTTANCSWTAASNVSWLTTNSSGTGNGTVNFSVAANTGNTRNGAINVGGQTFTVFQSAGNGSGCPSTTISLGQTINATLDTSCVFTGTSRYIDPYNFTGTAGQQIVIAMSSTAFDTYLFLDGPNNQTIAQDDDGGGGTNSRIPTSSGSFTLPATGTYRIWVTSYSADGTTGSTGPYTISLFSAQPIQLVLEEFGPSPSQAAALDGMLFIRDPFPVVNVLNPGFDKNTRVIIYTTNLQLAPGETASAVVVNLIDSNNQSYDVAAEDVRSVPNSAFTQVIFRLPTSLAVGTCTIKVKAYGQVSNAGTIRIRL
jgi:Zn-dependent metalloprotease